MKTQEWETKLHEVPNAGRGRVRIKLTKSIAELVSCPGTHMDSLFLGTFEESFLRTSLLASRNISSNFRICNSNQS